MGIEPQISCVENDYFANANDLLLSKLMTGLIMLILLSFDIF